MQTIIGLFIVLVIILSMGLYFSSSKEGFKVNTGKPNTPTPNTPTSNTPTPNTPTQNTKEQFTPMAPMNLFDDVPAHY